MDMQTALQTDYIGSQYSLQEFYLYKDASGADFYVDAVHIGKNPTTIEDNGTKLMLVLGGHYTPSDYILLFFCLWHFGERQFGS